MEKKKICGCGLSAFDTHHRLDILQNQIKGLEELIKENVDVEYEYNNTLDTLWTIEQNLEDMRYYCGVDIDGIKNKLNLIESALNEAIYQKKSEYLEPLPVSLQILKEDIAHLLRECLE